MQTLAEYDAVIDQCRQIFLKKTKDYGTAWRVLRITSITDQVFIKAQRIRTLEEKQQQRIADDIQSEYIGIVNYCLIALMQLCLKEEDGLELTFETVKQLFEEQLGLTRELMLNKNHDYGEAWRNMRVSSLTDLILMKLLRVKQIEDNAGKTIISEGVDANYRDILNYAVFALIRMQETSVLN